MEGQSNMADRERVVVKKAMKFYLVKSQFVVAHINVVNGTWV